MRVIITGGTGLIGRPLSAALVADGHDVTVLTRDPQKVKDMPAGVKLAAWDGQSAHGWGELADGAGAIINLAGENLSGGRWTKASGALAPQILHPVFPGLLLTRAVSLAPASGDNPRPGRSAVRSAAVP